jgi:hypothetical protein
MLAAETMRSIALWKIVGLVALAWPAWGCATQKDTGRALVTGGAVVATAGALAASSSYCAAPSVCYNQANNSKEAIKYALAGATVAAAGYALIETAPEDRPASKAGTPNSAPTCCRLQRRDPLSASEEEPKKEAPKETAPQAPQK